MRGRESTFRRPQTQKLYREAKRIIPGGTQLFSKRPELYLPEAWPAYFAKARGCRVWDLDGRSYADMASMGIGTCLLGYADPNVNIAVHRVVRDGNISTLNAPEEVNLAHVLIALHPWADMARFARTGGEAMSIAVRIARAKTGRDTVLFCGYHGWHDWYLSANLEDRKSLDGQLLPGLTPRGVPRSLQGTALPFTYNDTAGFRRRLASVRGRVAAVVLESIRSQDPAADFLRTIERETRAAGAVLIVDEITAGFRMALGGAHLLFGLKPDMAVFAKGMSNGYPMSAVIGTAAVMSAAQDTFISSTYWTERIGPTAALATIAKLRETNGPAILARIGREVRKGWEMSAKAHDIPIKISGIDPLLHLDFQHSEPLLMKSLFTQMMLDEGFLATNAFYASLAHEGKPVEKYLAVLDRCFFFMGKALRNGTVRALLRGPICMSGFKRLT